MWFPMSRKKSLCFPFRMGFMRLTKDAENTKPQRTGLSYLALRQPERCTGAAPTLPRLKSRTQKNLNMWKIVDQVAQMRDRVIKFWLGPKLIIMVTDAKIFETLLRSPKCAMKDEYFYESLTMFADGFFSKIGKRWSKLRKPLDPFLHPTSVQNYGQVFATKTSQLCESLDEKCGKGVFDIEHCIKYCSLDIILETVLGVPGTQMKKDTLNIPDVVQRMATLQNDTGRLPKDVRIECRIDWIFNLLAPGKHKKILKKEINGILNLIVENRKKDHVLKSLNPNDPDFRPTNYTDVLIQLARNANVSPDDSKYDALAEIIVAGYDTTSVTVSSAFLFLAMHPEYQEKVYNEQFDVMGDSLEAPTREQMSEMNYLTMVFHETLRHVGVPGFMRTVDSEIEVDGYVFPEGSSLYINIHGICKNPKYWKQPNDFYPDHFLPEYVAERPKGAFLPFSSGSRVCPGKAFANNAVKIMLSMLIRRYWFTSPLKFHEIIFIYGFMVESSQGYPVELTRRVH